MSSHSKTGQPNHHGQLPHLTVFYRAFRGDRRAGVRLRIALLLLLAGGASGSQARPAAAQGMPLAPIRAGSLSHGRPRILPFGRVAHFWNPGGRHAQNQSMQASAPCTLSHC